MTTTLRAFDYGLIAASLTIATAGQFLLKWGMQSAIGGTGVSGVGQLLSRAYVVRLATTWQVLLALTMYAAGAFLWMSVLSRMPVSVAYPFLGVTYLVVLLADWLINSVPLTPAKAVGTLLVVAGIYLIGSR